MNKCDEGHLICDSCSRCACDPEVHRVGPRRTGGAESTLCGDCRQPDREAVK